MLNACAEAHAFASLTQWKGGISGKRGGLKGNTSRGRQNSNSSNKSSLSSDPWASFANVSQDSSPVQVDPPAQLTVSSPSFCHCTQSPQVSLNSQISFQTIHTDKAEDEDSTRSSSLDHTEVRDPLQGYSPRLTPDRNPQRRPYVATQLYRLRLLRNLQSKRMPGCRHQLEPRNVDFRAEGFLHRRRLRPKNRPHTGGQGDLPLLGMGERVWTAVLVPGHRHVLHSDRL